MRWFERSTVVCGVGLALVALLSGGDAVAGGKNSWRPKRGKVEFESAPAPQGDERPSDPNAPSDPTNGSGELPDPGGLVGGGLFGDGLVGNDTSFGGDAGLSFAPGPVYYGGELLAMADDRAWVLSPQRGLSVVDVSDPDTPVVVGSVPVEGAAQRALLDGDRAAILSGTWSEGVSDTVVTSVSVGPDGRPVVHGSSTIDGYLFAADFENGELLIVTQEGYGGMLLFAEGTSLGAAVAGADATSFGAPGWVWAPATTRVTRWDLSGDADPVLLGDVEIDGQTTGAAVTARTAYLVLDVQSPLEGTQDEKDRNGVAYPEIWPPIIVSELAAVRADDAGAPQLDGAAAMRRTYGAWTVNLAAETVRVLANTFEGLELRTFDVSGDGAPQALGSLELGQWPSGFVFTDDQFVYGLTEFEQAGNTPPPIGFFEGGENGQRTDPDHPQGDQFGSGFPFPNWVPPTPHAAVHVVDLTDPSAPRAAGAVRLGKSYLNGLWAAPDGVVGIRTMPGQAGGALFRIDTSDPDDPSLAGEVEFEHWLWVLAPHDDLLLLSGSVVTKDDGVYKSEAFLQVADLAGGDVRLAGRVALPTWIGATARDGDLFGLVTSSRLRLLDVSDVDAPRLRGELLLLVNVTAVEPLSDDVAAALTVDWGGGPIEIRTVALPGADALSPLDTLEVSESGYHAELLADPPYLYVLVPTSQWDHRATLKVVDASDPSNLTLRGSLDLGCWPTQSFLHEGALLMLRQSAQFFADPLLTGEEPAIDDVGPRKRRKGQKKKKRKKKRNRTTLRDDFGAVRGSWLQDEISAVIDVVDLADPDAPEAAARKRLRHDFGWRAILAGDTLYVPIYRHLVRPDAPGVMLAYGVQSVDVTEPLEPRVRRAVNVPGALVGATRRDGRVLTAEYRWPVPSTQQTGDNLLHLVDLAAPVEERIVASRRLPGYAQAVAVGEAHAYVVAQTLSAIVLPMQPEDWSGSGMPFWTDPKTELLTLSLRDLSLTDEHERKSGAWDGRVIDDFLFLQGWGFGPALDVYDLADPSAPEFQETLDTYGDTGRLRIAGNRLLIPAGFAGIRVFDL